MYKSLLKNKKQKINLLDNEVFRPLPFAPCYQVSNMGRIIGIYGKLLSPENKGDYERVFIKTIDGIYKHFQLHRLIAEMFCYGADISKEVHHINRNSHDNRAVNLVWCTSKQHDIIHRSILRKRKEM